MHRIIYPNDSLEIVVEQKMHIEEIKKPTSGQTSRLSLHDLKAINDSKASSKQNWLLMLVK
jgi:hypothetical protein